MQYEANKCPKCQGYILGTQCYICNIDVRLPIDNQPKDNPFEDIFGKIFKNKDVDK